MINLMGLSNVIKPVKQNQNNSASAYRFMYNNLKADTFERSNAAVVTTCPISFTGKSNRLKQYKKVTDTLNQTAENAQISLNGQIAADGWAGRVADGISVLWNSKNRAKLVQADIDAYKAQVKDLEASIPQNKFIDKFKEMFGVEYHQSNINKYNKKANQFRNAVTTECMAKLTEEKLSKSIGQFNRLSGNLQDITEKKVIPNAMTGSFAFYEQVTSKEDIFNKMEKSLVDVLGDKKVLNSVLAAGGLNVEHSTMEEKYKAYGFVANFLLETSKETAKEYKKGQTLEEIKKDYEKAYEKAYGNKNDIQERVDKYNRSQEIGAAAVRGVTRSALAAVATIINPPAGLGKIVFNSALTFGIKVAVDGSDKLTNGVDNSIDLNAKAMQKMVRSASISAAEKLASGGVGILLPDLTTGSEALDFGLNQFKNIIVDTSIGLTAEKIKKGKWATNQILPRMIISAVFRNLGSDNELADELLSMTKGGINQAMKSSTRDYDVVKTFLDGTRLVIDENYLHDNEIFGDLKDYAEKHPDKYEALMLDLLQKEIDERAEEKKNKKEVK